jgi:tRNA threonylcarbamoyladenosine biosynthesis protein TsaE
MNQNEQHEQNIQRKVPVSSLDETLHIALQIAHLCVGGEVITLTGDLGAGKTSFTQGFAKGLGVKRHVNSPTFTLIKEYQGTSLALYHMDAYRIGDEFEELGLEEYFYGQGVSVIEWPQMIMAQLPAERLDITITRTGDHSREFTFTPHGERYQKIVSEVSV